MLTKGMIQSLAKTAEGRRELLAAMKAADDATKALIEEALASATAEAPAATGTEGALPEETMKSLEQLVERAIQQRMAPLTQAQTRRTPPAGSPDVEVRGANAEKPKEKGIAFAQAVQAVGLSKALGRSPADVAENILGAGYVAKALSTSTGTAGGILIPEELSSDFLDLRYNRTIIRKLGAQSIPVESGNLTISGLSGGATANYIGEGTGANASQQTFRGVKFSAKKLEAKTPISNDLIRRANPRAQAIVRDNLLNVISLKEDLQGLRGAGGEHSPKGLRNLVKSANVFATAGAAAPTLAQVRTDVNKVLRLIDESNSAKLRLGWGMTPRIARFLAAITDGNGNAVYEKEINSNRFMGYPLEVTNQIPNNLGAGSDESEIYFGDWNDFLIGETLQLLVKISDEASYKDANGTLVSAFDNDETIIQVITEHDFNVAYADAFAIMKTQWGS